MIVGRFFLVLLIGSFLHLPAQPNALTGPNGSSYKNSKPLEAKDLVKRTCKNFSCGGITIPYPFGIGPECYANTWYSIRCDNSSTNSPKPYLNHTNLNLEVLMISLEYQRVTVKRPMSLCTNNSETEIETSSMKINLDGSPFKFSWDFNKFMVFGCGSALVKHKNGTVTAGCVTICDDSIDTKGCFGIHCCEITIPSASDDPFTGYTVDIKKDENGEDCVRLAVMDRYWLSRKYSRREFHTMGFVPVVLEWRADIENDSYSTHGCGGWRSFYSQDYPDPCACRKGTKGNPLLKNGCRGMLRQLFIILCMLRCWITIQEKP